MNREQLRGILNSLTLEEKIGQLFQLSAEYFDSQTEITGPLADIEVTQSEIACAGSVIGNMDAKSGYKIQKEYLEKSRHKIPLLFMADIIHGSQTIFPIPLGAASSFNPELIHEIAKYSGIEAASSGVHVTFSPMADLARDARWGRNMETNGEDPYLNKILTGAYVKGYQGDTLSSNSNLISCVKHFAGYGSVEAGREYNFVDISERMLHEFHYPSYKQAIDSGCQMVMSSFNVIDSIPATVNQKLLNRDLRGKLGFSGVLISDWAAITELINHKMAANLKDCAKQAVLANVDIDMMSMAYLKTLKELVEEKQISIKQLDEMVMRVLNLKNDFGLFENPYKNLDETYEKEMVCSKEMMNQAKKAADQSIVLLKNNGSLPINGNYAIYGKHVSSKEYFGPWSWQGKKSMVKSIEEVFIQDLKCLHIPYRGSGFEYEQFAKVETVNLFIGEYENESGEAKSKSDIRISPEDVAIVKKLSKFGKKINAIILAGRPMDLSSIDTYCESLIYAWYPGTMAAESLYDIITGAVNPSAKLAMSLPRNVGQCPIFYNQYPTGRPMEKAKDSYVSKYIDVANTPLYQFGHGLNYSSIKIDKISFDSEHYPMSTDVSVNISLTNQSDVDGTEIVQVYINDLVSSLARPKMELKAFKRIDVPARETISVSLTIAAEEFGYVNSELEHIVEPGEFEIKVGINSNQLTNNIITIGEK